MFVLSSLPQLYTGSAPCPRNGWHCCQSCQGGFSQSSTGDAHLMGAVWSPWDRDDCHKGRKVGPNPEPAFLTTCKLCVLTVTLTTWHILLEILSQPHKLTHKKNTNIHIFRHQTSTQLYYVILVSSYVLCSALNVLQENVPHVPGPHFRHESWVRICSAHGFHPCRWQEIQVCSCPFIHIHIKL